MATAKKKPVAKKVTPVAKKTKPVSKKTAVSEKEVPMKVFTCQKCKQKFPDMSLYFYGKASKKCMWCTKFPSRNVDKK